MHLSLLTFPLLIPSSLGRSLRFRAEAEQPAILLVPDSSVLKPLTPDSITTDPSIPYWQHKQWNYHTSSPTTNFSIHMIDGPSSPAPPLISRAEDLESEELGKRQDDSTFWACVYNSRCYDPPVYQVQTPVAKEVEEAVYTAVRERLSSNDNELLKRIAKEDLVRFAIGVEQNGLVWYITSTLQIQNTRTTPPSTGQTDTCNLSSLSVLLDFILTNFFNVFYELRYRSDSRPRLFDHGARTLSWDRDVVDFEEGRRLLQAVKLTRERGEYKGVVC